MFVFLVEHLAEIFIIFSLREALPAGYRLPVVYIAENSDLSLAAFKKTIDITFAFAADSDTCNNQFITRRYIASSKHMPGHNVKARHRGSSVFNEFSARIIL